MGRFRRFFRRFSGGDEEGRGGSHLGGLTDEELERIGTEEDPLADYEEALRRNFEAMEAEGRGDVERAILLYEQNVAERFVESHPYERLAMIYERRRRYAEALRVTESFIELARSGTMPRGAQRSADRRLAGFEERAERYRRMLGSG
ncbi:hypothetical protein [Rubrobacter calidifluminis]|uniref:hypothetical protein n=1 Tax=Rubrobacter calidifluminis TaxID=1392640 RepID=UPI002362B968|nr:hypothetical protein [Rubrobacter calidifluminis]